MTSMTSTSLQNGARRLFGLREDRLPTMFCPGCGIGTVVTAYVGALQDVGLDPQRVCTVTGIGCTGRVGGYLSMDTVHTTHGRALAVATGAQAVRPDLKFVVFTGDGDALSIGGNHLIHAARRNMRLTVIMVNNFNYGLTGGQASPTTPANMITTTTPEGKREQSFDACKLVTAAGAAFVARWTTLHPRELRASIAKALNVDGFAFVEALSQCPPAFGRRNDLAEPEDLLAWIERHTAPEVELEKIARGGELALPLGEFVGGAS